MTERAGEPRAPWPVQWLARHRADAASVLLLALAGLLYPRVPVVLWLVTPALVVAHLAGRLRKLSREDLTWILGCCAGTFTLQMVVLIVWGYHDPLASSQKLDDYQYFESARAVAGAWRTGFYPALSLKGSPPYIGSLHTGYERLLAALFVVFGPSVKVGIAANVATLTLLPLLAFLLAQSLFGLTGHLQAVARMPDWLGWQAEQQRLQAPPRVARNAALLAACHLAYQYWAGWLLKDLVLAASFALALLLLLDLLQTPRAHTAIAFGGMLGFVTILRAYAGLSLLAGIALLVLARLPRRVALWGFLYLGAALWALSYTEKFGRYFEQLYHSLETMLPAETRTLPGTLRYFARGLPRLLLAPYAWVKAYGPNPQYGAYPGMWFLYLVIYPFALAGFGRAARQNHLLSTLPFACLSFAALIFLMAYGGDASRQRLWLEMILIAYAALGLSAPTRWRFALPWYVLLGGFALVQLATLGSRYGR